MAVKGNNLGHWRCLMRKMWVTLALMLSVAALAGCNPPPTDEDGGTSFRGDTDTIKIGINLVLTGDFSSFGTSCWNGIELALDEINKKGVLGKKIEPIKDDNKGKGTEAANVAKKQIEMDKVVLMIGAVASTNTIAMSHVAQEKRIPQVTPASTRTDITVDKDGNVKKYIFRTCFTDDFQADAIANFCWEDLGARRIAILYDNGQDYSKGIYQRVKQTFIGYGGVVAAERTYDAKVDKDFRAHLSQIKTKQFDVLVVPGYYLEVGMIAQQARELGIEQTIVGGDGLDSPQLIEVGGDAIEGTYFTTHFSAEDPDPKIQAFVSKYRSQYGILPDAMAVLGYDAMNIVADAIERAGSADPEAITKALHETKNFPAVSGDVTINELHNAVKDIVVIKVEDGKFKLHKSIKAERESDDTDEAAEEPGDEGSDDQ